jgi:uncharacterized membrane protein
VEVFAMAMNRTQLLAILAIIVQLAGQLGLSAYAEILQTIGTAIISVLVLFGIVQIEKVKTALRKAKML